MVLAEDHPLLSSCWPCGVCPTLTGLAQRVPELSPDIGLDTHIQDVVGLLVDKDLHGVILVGHSYGGMVITGVVDAVPERIAHLSIWIPLCHAMANRWSMSRRW